MKDDNAMEHYLKTNGISYYSKLEHQCNLYQRKEKKKNINAIKAPKTCR